MTHDDVTDRIDAYVIGALESDEAREVEAHLADCDLCAAEAAEANAVAGLLALAAPHRRHGDTLRARVLSAVVREARQPVTGPGLQRAGWSRFMAAAVAVLLVGAFAWSAALQVQVSDLRDTSQELETQVRLVRVHEPDVVAVKAQAQEAMSAARVTYRRMDDYQALLPIVTSPASAHARMRGTAWAAGLRADVYWDPERHVFAFLFEGMPPAPDGKAYQLWLWRDGVALDAGTFEPTDKGRASAVVPSDASGLRDFDDISVTLEPDGGSRSPTGTVLCTLR